MLNIRRSVPGTILAVVAALFVAGCGGGSSKSAAATSGAGSNRLAVTGTTTNTPNGGAVDPCAAITLADVQKAVGGTVSLEATTRKPTACIYDITGTTRYGPVGLVGGGVQLEWVPSWTPFARAQSLGATQVSGVGLEAWVALSALHADIHGGDLSILVNGVGTPQDRLQAMADLAKAAVHNA
jgi:hypothetical protein